jgi:hypothetical protein
VLQKAKINIGEGKGELNIEFKKQEPSKEELIKADTPNNTNPTTTNTNQHPSLDSDIQKQLEEIKKTAEMMKKLEGMINAKP